MTPCDIMRRLAYRVASGNILLVTVRTYGRCCLNGRAKRPKAAIELLQGIEAGQYVPDNARGLAADAGQALKTACKVSSVPAILRGLIPARCICAFTSGQTFLTK